MAHLARIVWPCNEVATESPGSTVRQFTQPRFSAAVGAGGPDAASACIERIARVFNPMRRFRSGYTVTPYPWPSVIIGQTHTASAWESGTGAHVDSNRQAGGTAHAR